MVEKEGTEEAVADILEAALEMEEDEYIEVEEVGAGTLRAL